MKKWKNNPLLLVPLVVVIAALFTASLVATAADNNSNSGVPGLSGPEFTFGVFLGGGAGNNPAAASSGSGVFNGAPYALSGYVLAKFNGTLHIWITEESEVVKQLGFKVGDVVEVFCAPSQVTDLNTGDYVTIYGFTVRGYLVRADDVVLPAPFSY